MATSLFLNKLVAIDNKTLLKNKVKKQSITGLHKPGAEEERQQQFVLLCLIEGTSKNKTK